MDGLVCTVAPRGHAAAHAGAQDFARTQLVGILEAGGAAGAAGGHSWSSGGSERLRGRS